ncbi:hypothetical protein AVEN_1629-1 [Araneus ventricosus]|uniref:Uncharacterized protein n=1 Tax=Araneus ventricosus TaxID=182803 RepID=A0A4Y2R350_ARAVE|nr:hypothetical protein AVEN_1629-1 [Araneus ventricosus]
MLGSVEPLSVFSSTSHQRKTFVPTDKRVLSKVETRRMLGDFSEPLSIFFSPTSHHRKIFVPTNTTCFKAGNTKDVREVMNTFPFSLPRPISGKRLSRQI